MHVLKTKHYLGIKQMSYDTFWQSMLANAALLGALLGYKLLKRVVGRKCHYTREHGLEIHLADPEEDVDLAAINEVFENRGISMRIRDTASGTV